MTRIAYIVVAALLATGCNRADPLSYVLYQGSRDRNDRTEWATFQSSTTQVADVNRRRCTEVASALRTALTERDGEFWCEVAASHS